jgi:hypothetical protein
MTISLGMGTSVEFFSEEFCALNLKDKRLNARAKKIFVTLQSKLGSCIRRLFTSPKEARQAYDFFFQSQHNEL